MTRRYSLFYLLPYLARHRLDMSSGFLMVVLTVVASMFGPWVLKYVVDDLETSVVAEKLPIYAAMIVGIAVVEGFFRFWMRKILIGVSRRIEYELRNDFFAHLQRMSLSFFHSHPTGDIMSRATNDLNAVRSVLDPGIRYSMTTFVTAVCATSIVLRTNSKLTLLQYLPLALFILTVRHFALQINVRFARLKDEFC